MKYSSASAIPLQPPARCRSAVAPGDLEHLLGDLLDDGRPAGRSSCRPGGRTPSAAAHRLHAVDVGRDVSTEPMSRSIRSTCSFAPPCRGPYRAGRGRPGAAENGSTRELPTGPPPKASVASFVLGDLRVVLGRDRARRAPTGCRALDCARSSLQRSAGPGRNLPVRYAVRVGSSRVDPFSPPPRPRPAVRPPQGGANEQVLRMLSDIGSVDNVRYIDRVKGVSCG